MMISVAEAQKIILQKMKSADVAELPILQSAGAVLAEKVKAERDYPPFDRVTMDGIGISFSQYAAGRRDFAILGVVGAGYKAPPLEDKNGCLEVMTGAVCPAGIDCVIPVELIEVNDGVATIVDESSNIQANWNIHPQASDCPADTVLLEEGLLLDACSIAVAASEGKEQIKVKKRPRLAVISSGDELVALHEKPQPWQIRRSNNYAIAAQLEQMKLADVEVFHINDDKVGIKNSLEKIIADFDYLILSGAVSKGIFDYLPEVLDSLGVEKHFHRIQQRPGKPMWFGTTSQGKAVFALPGNPVSAVSCFRRYVVPALAKFLGMPTKPRKAVLSEDFTFKKTMTYFLPVRTHFDENGTLQATPVKVNGSGDFSTLAQTDGFIELEAEIQNFSKGHVAAYYAWDKI